MLRNVILGGLLTAIVGGSALLGATVGGGVVYWTVRDRLVQAPANTPQTEAPALPPLPQTVEINVNTAIEDAVTQVGPAVVTVVNTYQTMWGAAQSSGSGVFISKEGYLITNNHVVEGYQRLEVILPDGQTLPAELVGTDAYADIAVLKVEAKEVPAVATFGNSDTLNPGETVIAIGSPLGNFRNTVTVGVVSATGRSLQTDNNYLMEDLIQTDAAINHGNSGGPLVNLAGQIVGINTMVVRGNGFTSDQAEGLGFAIAANTAQAISEQLIAKGFVARPYLGISWNPVTPAVAQANDLPAEWGVYVASVGARSPADNGGLQVGDVITHIGQTPLDADHPFTNTLWQHAPGDTVTLTVARGNETLKVEVTLGERPHN